MDRQPLDEGDFQTIRDEMLRYFAEDGYLPVEASADELVSVVMDARFQLQSVSIQGVRIEPEERQALEQAIVKAVNELLQEISRRNAERLTQAMDEAGKA